MKHVNTITVKTLARNLNLNKETLTKMCQEGKIRGAVFNEDTKTYHVPTPTIFHIAGACR